MQKAIHYRVLACDYDGTIADDGTVNATTIDALKRFVASGRRLVLVTGRELANLRHYFPQINLFDYVVVENGAALYQPASEKERRLANPPPPHFVELLQQRGVTPLSVGHTIVATVEPYHAIVLQTIRDLGLELQVIFNKGAVMILPSGVNKATGLGAALAEMGLSPQNVVAIGDGENDHSLLSASGLGIAVRNAVPTLQAEAAYVTRQPASRGVIEVMDWMLKDDLASLVVATHPAGKPEQRSDGGTPLVE